jgi:putative peptide zinc metalloprotease protein
MCTRYSAPDPDDAPTPTPTPTAAVPRLTEGTELVGEFEGSGYRTPPQLIHRFDGQVVQLPPLLYQAVKALQRQGDAAEKQAVGQAAIRAVDHTNALVDGRQLLSRTAEDLERSTGRRFTADHVAFLLDQKLAPLGITTYSDGAPPALPKANPFLGLRFRLVVLPERATWFVSGLFAWLYRPVVLVLAVTAFLAGEVWVFATRSPGPAMAQVMADPTSVLLVALLTLASSAFHELGHAAACRYGNVRPGHMGCGIYVVWPAFYTDVTNSYRLGRSGRIRTDLGGVYFNGLFVAGLAALYAHTGSPVLLVSVLATNLEIVQQLLPTLRFDGYYIVADLVGIPDLFKYIGPILKRAVLRQPPDQRLDALKRWPQLVITVWVLTVLPVLALQLGIVVVRMPELAATAWSTVASLAAGAAAGGTPVLGVVSAAVQILFLLLPLAGAVLIVWQMLRLALRLLLRRRPGRGGAGEVPGEPGARLPVPRVLGGLAVSTVLALGGTGPARSPRPTAPLRGRSHAPAEGPGEETRVVPAS